MPNTACYNTHSTCKAPTYADPQDANSYLGQEAQISFSKRKLSLSSWSDRDGQGRIIPKNTLKMTTISHNYFFPAMKEHTRGMKITQTAFPLKDKLFDIQKFKPHPDSFPANNSP